MLRWIILTAARFNEAYSFDGGEVKGNVWTIPAARMKGDRIHTVPLTAAALAQLPFRSVSDVTLANAIARHTDSPATTHGFRSTFRDWAGDCTNFPRDVAEMALAHAVGNETEAAYRRSTALAKRRELLEAWATYCCSTMG
jgi:integrase